MRPSSDESVEVIADDREDAVDCSLRQLSDRRVGASDETVDHVPVGEVGGFDLLLLREGRGGGRGGRGAVVVVGATAGASRPSTAAVSTIAASAACAGLDIRASLATHRDQPSIPFDVNLTAIQMVCEGDGSP